MKSEKPPIKNLSLTKPLWDLKIKEIEGFNIEIRGRKKVNRLLKEGWLLLHIYTLLYKDNGVWRQKPMAILGKKGK